MRATTFFRWVVCSPHSMVSAGASERSGAVSNGGAQRRSESTAPEHAARAPHTSIACRTPVTLDPAPPACYAKRADSDAGSSVPRAAVGSDSLARFRGCFKGASRRAMGAVTAFHQRYT